MSNQPRISSTREHAGSMLRSYQRRLPVDGSALRDELVDAGMVRPAPAGERITPFLNVAGAPVLRTNEAGRAAARRAMSDPRPWYARDARAATENPDVAELAQGAP
ncbi:MAG: hypothetical protein OZ921_15330 [Sorangiineae bacterium]|nr:hypothetical protein [Polyangiaceae bacterium]MEB2323883.1 hypothetical protein [Sorangiineae bacterium]